jgi:peptidoglycan/xylan/chitin deacetylase (PgdA/CDA1 family)
MSFLQKSGAFRLLRVLPGPDLVIFNYHRIRGAHPTLFDDDVFSTHVDQFQNQMTWLKKSTRILSETDLLQALRDGKPLRERCSMVTFDDGYRDNYDLAYPILRKLQIPATFFVPTEPLTSRKLGAWDIAAYLIKKSTLKKIQMQGVEYPLNGDRQVIVRKIVNLTKDIWTEKVGGFLDELSAACEVPFPDRALQDAELMTWEQVSEVAANGITIGSHTHNHPVLSQTNLKMQERELLESKEILERRLGREIKSFAYPDGGYERFNLETKSLAAKFGYSLAFSYHTGSNTLLELDRYDIRRISPPATAPEMALVFSMPSLEYHSRKGTLTSPLKAATRV